MKRQILHGFLVAIGAASIAILLGLGGALDWIENHTWDWRARLMADKAAASPRIRLVFLDQTTLDWGQSQGLSWPWMRETYSTLLAFCRRGGARAVAFDLVFSETSAYGPADDEAFGAAIGATTGFVAAAVFSAEQGLMRAVPEGYALHRPTVAGLDAWAATAVARDLTMPRASLPVAPVGTNATLVANVAGSLSHDTVVRRTVPFRVFDGRFFPSLGLAAYLAAHPQAAVAIRPGVLEVDGRVIPLDERGQAILRYRGVSQTHATVSAQAVLQSEVNLQAGEATLIDPAVFKDAYVFLGVTAPGLFDLKASPTARVYPGVEVHATFLDNLLRGDFIRPTPFRTTAMLALLMALVAGVAGRLCRSGVQTALAFLAFLPVPLAVGFAGYAAGFWVQVAPAEVATALALVGATILNYAIEGKQKRFIKGAFRQYLSPAVIERLVKDPDHLTLGGETRELSIYFSDIQGFTSISEKLTPEQLTTLLNEYLTAMSDIIMENGGTIDKYEGDAVIAFWNAPLDLADHAACAVRSALLCQRKLAELRPAFRERVGRDLFCRVGVNTGKVVVGNMGSHQRFNYTFLGDAGNLASRLEGINKSFGTYSMISEFTRSQLGEEIAARELARVRVVGKAQPVRVFEPMFKADYEARRPLFEAFAAALAAYNEGRLEDALKGFEALAEADPPSAAYAKRCRSFLLERPEPWDGVWTMTEK